MWVQALNRHILVNIETGQRLAILPTVKDQGATLYGVFVQTPMREIPLPLDRAEYAGYNNTPLLADVPLDDCENLLEIYRLRLDARRVPAPPIEENDAPAACFLHITDSLGNPWRYICGTEEVAWKVLYGFVKGQWPHSLVKDQTMPEDPMEAIELYYRHKQSKENYELFVNQILEPEDVGGTPH